MTAPHAFSTLAVSLALLGLVAWMATSHSAGGQLFAPSAYQAEVRPPARLNQTLRAPIMRPLMAR